MMKDMPEKVTRKTLLSLPARKWAAESVYDSLYLVPTGKKHDSGWMILAIVGVINGSPQKAEIAAYCDDICWSFPTKHPYDQIQPGKHKMVLRTDCHYSSGIVHMWASSEHYFRGRFKVGASLSSTDVELIIEPSGDAGELLERTNGPMKTEER